MGDTREENGRAEALPRDITRFKKLYPNGRATIKKDATPTLMFLSTIEMINERATA